MDAQILAAEKMAQIIESEIKSFVRESPLNRMPGEADTPIFEEPLVGFADGSDPLFQEFKTIIGPNHLTPIEALVLSYNKQPEDGGKLVSVVSWILPITKKTRESNREQDKVPAKYWAYTKWYGEKFNAALRKHVVDSFKIRGYMTTAPRLATLFQNTGRPQRPILQLVGAACCLRRRIGNVSVWRIVLLPKKGRPTESAVWLSM